MQKYKIYIPEFIYGSMDGVITTFAIVAASAGAGLSSGIVLVLGFANVLADGFSMGSSAYLSAGTDKGKDEKPIFLGIATFVAFLIAGMVPLSVYVYDVIAHGASHSSLNTFYVSAALTLLVFAAIGYAKSRVEKTNALFPIISTIVLGVIAAGLSYFAGEWLARLLGVAA